MSAGPLDRWTPPAATPHGVESRHDLTGASLPGGIDQFVGDPAFPIMVVAAVLAVAAAVGLVLYLRAERKRGNW